MKCKCGEELVHCVFVAKCKCGKYWNTFDKKELSEEQARETELECVLDRIAENIGVTPIKYLAIENDTARNWMNIGGNPFPEDAEPNTLVALVFDDEGVLFTHNIVYVISKDDLENCCYHGETFEN